MSRTIIRLSGLLIATVTLVILPGLSIPMFLTLIGLTLIDLHWPPR